MVTTRSGRNTETKMNKSTNSTKSISTRSTRTNRPSHNTKTCSKQNVRFNIFDNKCTNFSSKYNNYIYRTVNINDMSDFDKITKYANKYPTMMYVIRNKQKSQIAYGTCETKYVEDTFAKILANHRDVVSKVNLTMYIVFVNYSFVLDKLIHVVNYKLDIPNLPTNQQTYFNEYYILDESMFDKLITIRDNSLKYINCIQMKLQLSI